MGKHICALAGMLPGAMWIVGRPQRWQIAVYYAFLGVGTCLLHRQREQREREKEHGRRAEQKNGGHPGVFLAALLLLAVLGVSRSGEAELDMLDVGQGDACYLQTKEGYHLFVDGGSSNVGKVGTYRILPFLKYKGVKRLTAGWCLIPMKTTSADCGDTVVGISRGVSGSGGTDAAG